MSRRANSEAAGTATQQQLFSSDVVSRKVFSSARQTDDVNFGVVVRSREDEESDTDDEYSNGRLASNEEVSVSWFGSRRDATENQKDLQVVDRPFYFGEIVASASDTVGTSGVITGARMTVDLLTLDQKIIRNIDTRNVRHVLTHKPGKWVLGSNYANSPWLGKVEDVREEIEVEFRDGSRCIIDPIGQYKIETYSDVYWTDDSKSDFEGRDCRFYPGQRVKVKDRRVLETARWVVGGPSDHKRAVVCNIQETMLQLRWVMPIPTCSDATTAADPPPVDCAPFDVIPLEFDEYCNTDWCIGDWCMFLRNERDEENGAQQEGLGEERRQPPGRMSSLSRKKKLMAVICSHTVCDVRWQDGRLTKNVPGKDLIALKHCDDSDFWPNDFVITRQQGNEVRKSGVVQTVDHKARTAVVRWQAKTDRVEDFILLKEEETVSLYALDSHPDFGHYCIGSMVVLLDAERASLRYSGREPDHGATFGQIRALDNGKLHVMWADGSISSEYPAEVFCLDVDDDDDSYSYSTDYSYDDYSDEYSWETMSQEEVVVDDRGDPMLVEDLGGAMETRLNLREEKPDDEEPSLPFEVISEAPSDHYFKQRGDQDAGNAKKLHKIILKEWKILQKNLPAGVSVMAYEDRMDLMRAVIVGSPGTPYHYGLFAFDIFLPERYPEVPPEVYYWSHGYRINPNLYESGRVCLSLLGTWGGRGIEVWDPAQSSILQVLVSIQGLVLNKEPYYNEAGYDKIVGSKEAASASIFYNESARLGTLKSILKLIANPPAGFERMLRQHFRSCSQKILDSLEPKEGSEGFRMMVKQLKHHVVKALEAL